MRPVEDPNRKQHTTVIHFDDLLWEPLRNYAKAHRMTFTALVNQVLTIGATAMDIVSLEDIEDDG